MASLSEIAQGINLLKIAFPNYNPDAKATADLWVAGLGDLPGDTLKAAIAECLIDPRRQFAPSIGEIRGAALRLNAIAAGITEAWRAYEEVLNMPTTMVSRHVVEDEGNYVILEKALEFSHPLVESVARMMGWPGQFPTEMPAADRAQFLKAYEAELTRLMGDAGRLPVITAYIDDLRNNLGKESLPLITKTVRRLEAHHG
jgi:hypothetical protein